MLLCFLLLSFVVVFFVLTCEKNLKLTERFVFTTKKFAKICRQAFYMVSAALNLSPTKLQQKNNFANFF